MGIVYVESDLSEVISDPTIAYIAGFVDGEGYIGINRTIDRRNGKEIPRYYIRFSVAQCDPKPLLMLQEKFGGKIRMDKWKDKRPVYTYILGSKHALRVIRLLAPFLVVKQEDALIAMEFGHTMVFAGKGSIPTAILERREALYMKMKVLRHREFNLDGTIRTG